jgi:transcriptional regulator with XRE-family HTH domain
MIINENRMFGDIFKELRTQKKISQDKIADDLDISQPLIAKWESHQSTPSPEMLDYIADYFDVSTDFLIGRTNDKRYYSSNEDNKVVNILYSKVKELPEEQQQFILNVTNTIMNQIDNELDNK